MAYIHPQDQAIERFIQEHIRDNGRIKTVCEGLFDWFDRNVKYSRLSAPYFPLQRSDLDVISMQAGTCGDYANLVVSVFQRLGYEAKYAYVHKDCYGDRQDHICAAVLENNEWILVDATLPYRKWNGFHCPHQEYELLSPDAFEEKMKKEESYWTDVAKRWGNVLYAGLLYAPWIHEEIIRKTDTALESVFFLLSLDKQKSKTIYAYYRVYTGKRGTMPVMCMTSQSIQSFCFSCRTPADIWDNEQWSEAYSEADIPGEFQTGALCELKKCLARVLPDIDRVLTEL